MATKMRPQHQFNHMNSGGWAAKKPSVYADKGKGTEEAVQKWLNDEAARRAAFAFHRYPDARTAGTTKFPAQPSDFLVSSPWTGATHLEVKETQDETRFRKNNLPQFGKLLMFSLAGIKPFVLVNRYSLNCWSVLTAQDLFHAPGATSWAYTQAQTFATHREALSWIYEEKK